MSVATYDIGGRKGHLYGVGDDEYVFVEPHKTFSSVAWTTQLSGARAASRIGAISTWNEASVVVYLDGKGENVDTDLRSFLNMVARGESMSFFRIDGDTQSWIFQPADAVGQRSELSQLGVEAETLDMSLLSGAMAATASPMLAKQLPHVLKLLQRDI